MNRKIMTSYILAAVCWCCVQADSLTASVVEQWIARYQEAEGFPLRGSYASAIAVDAQGNVYVTGRSYGLETRSDYATIKYDRNGDEVWVARYNGPGDGADSANAIAVDRAGSVYVTGESYGLGTGSDYATIKYEQGTDGRSVREAWVARYNGLTFRDDEAWRLALDGEGNVYVTGSSDNNRSYATVKYDSGGNQVWVASHGGAGGRAIAVDGKGYVYVTGASLGIMVTIKYEQWQEGRQVREAWVSGYGGDGVGEAKDLAVDEAGQVYITGWTGAVGTRTDYATVKYDPAGNQLWAAHYGGPSNRDDFARAIAVDAEGNVYVTGGSSDEVTGGNYATVKYDALGNQLWVARYSAGSRFGGSATTALALDGNGNIYVTGYSRAPGSLLDYATVKYDPSGKIIWGARYDGPGNGQDYAAAVVVDGEGNVYITGQSDGLAGDEYATIKYLQK